MTDAGDPDGPLEEYHAAAVALSKAVSEMKTAAGVVAYWSASVAKWREGDLVRSGVTPPVQAFPSGSQLLELHSAYLEARKHLRYLFSLFPSEHRSVLKSPDAIEEEELQRS